MRFGAQTLNPSTSVSYIATIACVLMLACYSFHTVVLVGGRVYSFGLGSGGQLGLGSPELRLLPTPILITDGDRYKVSAVFAGGQHTFIRIQGNDWSRDCVSFVGNQLVLFYRKMVCFSVWDDSVCYNKRIIIAACATVWPISIAICCRHKGVLQHL